MYAGERFQAQFYLKKEYLSIRYRFVFVIVTGICQHSGPAS